MIRDKFVALKASIRIFRRTFLVKTTKKINSQFGEDEALKMFLKEDHGFYVDVGCWHPTKASNTYFLYKRGWRGVNIDLGEVKIRTFNLARPDDINVVAAVSDKEEEVMIENEKDFSMGERIEMGSGNEVGEFNVNIRRKMRTQTLTALLDGTKYKNKPIDLLTVDAEGHDFQVLNGLDFERYSPNFILVESHKKSIQDLLESPINIFLTEKNYRIVNWVGLTVFYKKDKL